MPRRRNAGAGKQHKAAQARSVASRRGAAFEKALEAQHAAYDQQGLAFIRHSPPKFRVTGQAGARCSGFFEGAGDGDYTGWAVVEGRTVGLHFDAKVIGKDSDLWSFARLCHNKRAATPDQALAFDACLRCGGVAFVLLAWPLVTVLVPWADLREAWWRWYREGGAPASLSMQGALDMGQKCRSRARWLEAMP